MEVAEVEKVHIGRWLKQRNAGTDQSARQQESI
jgi:hypothetical protein